MPDDGREAAAEAGAMRSALLPLTRATWDGRLAILEMTSAGASLPRVASWPTSYFERIGTPLLVRALGGKPGPRYGRWSFAYSRKQVWALTTVAGDTGQADLPALPALEEVVAATGGVGIFVAVGGATHEVGFAQWVERQVPRKGPPASRVHTPSAFRVESYFGLFLAGDRELEDAQRRGWLRASDESLRLDCAAANAGARIV